MNLPLELHILVLEKYFAQQYQGYTFYDLPQRIRQSYNKLDCWELLRWDETNIKLVVQWDYLSAVRWLHGKNSVLMKQLFKRENPILLTNKLKNIRILIKRKFSP